MIKNSKQSIPPIEPGKPPWRQKRFIFGLVAMLAFIGFFIRSGRDWFELLADDHFWDILLGVLGVFGVTGAYLSTVRGSLPTKIAKPPDKDSLILITMLALITVSALSVSACGGLFARHVKTDGDVEIEAWRGPPCRVIVRADGEEVSRVDGPGRCVISEPPPPNVKLLDDKVPE